MNTTTAEAGRFICHKTMNAGVPRSCLGPRCMAWRWHPIPRNWAGAVPYELRHVEVEPPRPPSVPASYLFVPCDLIEGAWAHWLEPDAEAEARRVGWCGLAGDVTSD